VKFSRDWLADFVEAPAAPELAARLTALGLAVEGFEPAGGDVVLHVDVTTNRPDCMSHLGLARELAVATGRPLRPPPNGSGEAGGSAGAGVEVTIEDAEGCPRCAARVVRGVRVGPSPAWLVSRLEAIGLRPINNVVDVTNYVLWEMGQPLHAYDLARVRGARIVVRRARAGESVITLDGVSRRLDPEVLVIADAEGPVGLAGVMGGQASEVTAATTDVLLEAAHFDPRRVRRGSARLGLHTDASHRFERGADPEAPPAALARAAALLAEIAGGRVLAGAVDVVAGLPPPLAGVLDRRRLAAFAGLEVPAADVERILGGLGFRLERLDGERWRVGVPSWRHYDFRETRPDGGVWEADLFEEVLRHVGLDRIPSALPPVAEPDAGSSAPHELRQRLRRHLASCGLAEAINYAFVSAEEPPAAPPAWREGEAVRLANPLSAQHAVMRRSLVPGLLGAARFNTNRGAPAVRLFEIGHLFPGKKEPEVETVAIVAGGTVGNSWDGPRELDLFRVKGWMEGLTQAFDLCLTEIPFDDMGLLWPGVVPGTGAGLFAPGDPRRWVGWLGRAADEEFPYPIFFAELDTSVLAAAPRFRTVTVPSRFPGIAMDLTLTHPQEVPWRALDDAIEELRTGELVGFELKDRYQGAGVPAGCVNTTIAFLYNAADRSLTQEEVNARHAALAEELRRRFGVARPQGD
jgi:phenylalanyl-tRNA synthetase beta chain